MFLEGGDLFAPGRALARESSELSKNRKSHCRYQTANVVGIMLAGLGCPGQGKKVSQFSKTARPGAAACIRWSAVM
jgi:hypothetical protein